MPMQAAWGGLQMQPGQQQQYNGQQQGVLGYPMQQGQQATSTVSFLLDTTSKCK